MSILDVALDPATVVVAVDPGKVMGSSRPVTMRRWKTSTMITSGIVTIVPAGPLGRIPRRRRGRREHASTMTRTGDV
ncbi:MAG TPA: hypothetical protein VNP20_17780 [Nocardioidaceae bacterium]|nr:hypothetical protein [Nocardioidaceae bacterium]